VGAIAPMRPNTPDDAIRAVARRQQRNVTYAQLRALGLSQDAIKHRLRKHLLHRVHESVYSFGGPPNTPLERAAAAVLACGAGAALSHGSALTLWGIEKHWRTPLHVTAPTDRRPSGLIVHRSRTVTRADIRTHFGIRATSPARTLLDCAPTLTSLARAVNDALHSPYMTQAQLAEVVQRCPTHRGAKLLLPFVASSAGPTRSEFEDRFRPFCREYDFPEPLINVDVCGYEVDALFPNERVIVELDGWDFHNDRAAFERDRNRDADLLAAGFVTVRITWDRLILRPAQEAAYTGYSPCGGLDATLRGRFDAAAPRRRRALHVTRQI
jgi:Protein of unknown function (DUF559)